LFNKRERKECDEKMKIIYSLSKYKLVRARERERERERESERDYFLIFKYLIIRKGLI
jgi:hypothetical protein